MTLKSCLFALLFLTENSRTKNSNFYYTALETQEGLSED